MAFTNARVDILIGNVESKLCGPVPVQRLDRELNAHLFRGPSAAASAVPAERALIFEPSDRSFLTGCLPRVKRILRREGVRYRVCDLRPMPCRRILWKLQDQTLRDYQVDVVERALQRGTGVIDIGTGGGKTLLAAAIAERLGLPTLWLVTTRTLLEQTRRQIRTLFDIEPGVIGSGTHEPRAFTVALAQVVARATEDLSRWSDGLLIFDEGHHAAAATYARLVRRVRARFNYFLSAVPFRQGGDQVVLDALTGGVLTGGTYSARYLIERGYACPVEVRIVPCRITGDMREKPVWRLYEEFLAANPERNSLVAGIARERLELDESVLVLVDRKEHGRRILDLLGDRAAFAHGDLTRAELKALVDRFANGSSRCLVATTGLFHEGISIQGIHALIQAGGLKSRAKVIQSIGRGMRTAPGKRRCLYVDFFDDDEARVLRAHSLQRMRTLREEGFDVPRSLGEAPSPREPEAITPAWSHVPDSRLFVLMDGDGGVQGTATCMRKDLVPERYCKKCEQPVCMLGGEISWREDAH